MPFGDRTGPRGSGPRTGRGLGFCAGFNSPGYMKGPGMGMGRGFGRGFGRGYGRGSGRGYGRGFGRGSGYEFDDPYYGREPAYYGPAAPVAAPYAEPTKEEETSYLKRIVESLESELKAMKDRLKEVTKKEK